MSENKISARTGRLLVDELLAERAGLQQALDAALVKYGHESLREALDKAEEKLVFFEAQKAHIAALTAERDKAIAERAALLVTIGLVWGAP